MKKFVLVGATVIFLLGAGCTSAPKGAYNTVTREDIRQKFVNNSKSSTLAWNQWKYAGSDDQYDYIYEYDQGDLYPNGFRYYKVARGTYHFAYEYPFAADFSKNENIFD